MLNLGKNVRNEDVTLRNEEAFVLVNISIHRAHTDARVHSTETFDERRKVEQVGILCVVDPGCPTSHVLPPELRPHLRKDFSEEATNAEVVSVLGETDATLFGFARLERGAEAIHVSVAHGEEGSDENRIVDLFITGAQLLGVLDALGQLLTVQALNTG
jgi:hypothetical protein